jgi:hypothetical protein
MAVKNSFSYYILKRFHKLLWKLDYNFYLIHFLVFQRSWGVISRKEIYKKECLRNSVFYLSRMS